MLKCSSQKNQTVALKKSDPTVFHQMHQAVPDVRVCVVAPPWITLTCRSVYNKNIVLILYKRKIKTRVWDGALQYVSTLAPQSRQKAQMSEFLFCSTDLNCIFFFAGKTFWSAAAVSLFQTNMWQKKSCSSVNTNSPLSATKRRSFKTLKSTVNYSDLQTAIFTIILEN